MQQQRDILIGKVEISMVRGVNQNVIEILDTGNECFERAILFVRSDAKGRDKDSLLRSAREFLSKMRLRPRFYTRGQALRNLLKLAAAFGSGLLAALLLGL